MRILHVVPSYLPAWRYGGPILSVHGLAAAQAGAGHTVEVFTTDADGPGRLDVPDDRPVDRDGVAVRYFRCGRPRRLYRSPALRAALSAEVAGFDLVHLHSVFLWPTWVAARAAGRRGVPYVVSPRGMLVGELIAARGTLRKRLWIHLFERRTLARSRAIVVTSDLEARDLRTLGLALAPVLVVPNGVEALPDDAAGDGTQPPYFLSLGRLAAKKRIEVLLDALARVPAARLVVAGGDDDGLRSGLEARARELGVAARAEFVGPVGGAAKDRLLAGARALLLASRSENFGNVVLESLAAGRPVVTTAAVGAAPLVERCVGGAVVEATPEAFAAAMTRLLAEPAEADQMGERGRRLVESELTWPRVAARMDAAYATVLGNGRGR